MRYKFRGYYIHSRFPDLNNLHGNQRFVQLIVLWQLLFALVRGKPHQKIGTTACETLVNRDYVYLAVFGLENFIAFPW